MLSPIPSAVGHSERVHRAADGGLQLRGRSDGLFVHLSEVLDEVLDLSVITNPKALFQATG